MDAVIETPISLKRPISYRDKLSIKRLEKDKMLIAVHSS